MTNITLSSAEHMKMFFAGADWLLRNQDTVGGWPVGVIFNKDRKKFPGADELPEGWHSAMAQGHALSVLSRAWLASGGDAKYSDAAVKALDLYSVSSQEGGFVARFMHDSPWYEEYPTEPSSFVLNGFMYSLLGLHDASEMFGELGNKAMADTAEELFKSGLNSLRKLLPLYDTGSGSVYDLRHFTMPGSPPKTARWDYHSTHVNLLYVLSTLDDAGDDLLLKVADRWRGYMVGQRAEHN